jgi:hypothetical protein
MPLFDFKGINIESIKLKLDSLIGRIYHKEEHNEKTLNLELKKTEVIGTQIRQQQIAKQIVLNFPEGLPQSDQAKLVKAVLGGGNDLIEETSTSPSPSPKEELELPASTEKSPTEDFLKKHYDEYLKDKSLLLGRGALLLIYRSREEILFSKEEIVFLTQSSLENDFPVWFWLFNHRERFENVVPLLQEVFKHSSQKIRRGVISSLNDFTDTADEIIRLMQSEATPEVLGYAVSRFLEREDTDRAQVIIANALTRKIIPILTEKSKKKVEKIKVDLGAAERRFLHSVIESGWQSEKLKALMILGLSAEESDLPFLEKILTQASYTNVTNLVLNCIKRIGKTNKADYIEKELLDTRWEETFIAHLGALVAVKYKAIFPKLLEWLGDISKVTGKFWKDGINERKLEEEIQEAISALLDKDTYELLIQYILDNYSPDTRYGNIMSWRHFWVLKKQKNNSEIIPLLKAEMRLKKFERWAEVTSELELEERKSITNKEQLLSLVVPEKSKQAFLFLRKMYETITPEQAMADVAPLIQKFRENLTVRLNAIASGEHPEDVKELAKNDLEKFLGENRMFFRLNRQRKKGSRYDLEGKEDDIFEALSEDIENFSIIEKEYFAHIFKKKTPEINTILLSSIGRPYEIIYDSISEDSGNIKELSNALLDLIKNNPNPLIRLKAIEARFRLDASDAPMLRAVTLSILIEARDNTKASRGMTRENDDWFVSEITYLWAINTLIEFGVPDDFTYIQESANREKILARNYHRYSYFFDYKVVQELLDLNDNLEDQEEKDNALSALNSLDYKWARKILGIKE